jgi:type IV secretory pathway protease TraF
MRVPAIVPMMVAVGFPAGSVALSQNVPLTEFPPADTVIFSMIRVGPVGFPIPVGALVVSLPP